MDGFNSFFGSRRISTRSPKPLPTAEDILATTARLSALEKLPTRPSLPYYAPAESLPAPLPTVDEILKTPPEAFGNGLGRNIYRVREHFLVKYGSCFGSETDISFQEGENMLFVQQSTNIPIPKLYAMFHDEETGLDFIIQEFIPGNCLGSVWRKLDGDQRKAIASQMRRNMDELVVSLPQATTVLNGSVFTHSHLYGSHLILREDGTVVMINWENAGWYPIYWEYCCSYIGGRTPIKDDWAWLVQEMLDVHVVERELMIHHNRLIVS